MGEIETPNHGPSCLFFLSLAHRSTPELLPTFQFPNVFLHLTFHFVLFEQRWQIRKKFSCGKREERERLSAATCIGWQLMTWVGYTCPTYMTIQ